MRTISAEQRAEIIAYTTGVLRARAEYAAHPTVAADEDWCVKCCWPRTERSCSVCRSAMGIRATRKAS